MLNITGMLSELKAERNRIDHAIAALEGLSLNGAAGRMRQRTIAPPRKRHHLSAQGRKRLSELMKKRWAERRKKAAARS